MTYRTMRIDGRAVEYTLDGPRDAAGLLVFHVGSPSAAVRYPVLAAEAGRRGLRTLIYSRAGYAGSDRHPGRAVADEALVTGALADRLGHARFFTAGWSGGGPSALACAAILSDRVRACVVLASRSPWREAGPRAGLEGPEGLADWRTLASNQAESLVPEYEAAAADFRRASPHWLRQHPGSTDTDRRALRPAAGIGVPLARSMRRAVSSGIWGWFDDNVAQALDWGFRVGSIRVPVVVRHGELDPLVSVGHGRWLAAAIPGARAEILPDAGHSSVADPLGYVVDTLLEAERQR